MLLMSHWWLMLSCSEYRKDRRKARRLKASPDHPIKLIALCEESSEPIPSYMLEGVDKRSKMYSAIARYLAIGQGDRPMELMDVFRVRETGKEEAMSGENRVMLWHGSSLKNVGGIISCGLKIRPEGIPWNGNRHGDGLYFADMACKSAHYCGHSTMGEERVLFLFEVALGTVQEEVEESKPLREGYDSMKALGRHFPDPDGDLEHPEGFRVPLGNAIVDGDCSREFNEFIVFSTPQARLRYLARVQMNWEHKQ